MKKREAVWAASLILDEKRKFRARIIASDCVIVSEMENRTCIAQTQTTEPALLAALIAQAEKSKK